MKTATRTLVCVLAVTIITVALVSCSGPAGTYGEITSVGGVQYHFSGSNVTITANIAGFEKSYSGKYKTGKNENGEKTITFSFDQEDASKYNLTARYNDGKDDNGKYIELDGVKFYKQ